MTIYKHYLIYFFTYFSIACHEDFIQSGRSSLCSKVFTDMKRTWSESIMKCQKDGLLTPTHTDIEANALRKYIHEKYGLYHLVSLSYHIY